ASPAISTRPTPNRSATWSRRSHGNTERSSCGNGPPAMRASMAEGSARAARSSNTVSRNSASPSIGMSSPQQPLASISRQKPAPRAAPIDQPVAAPPTLSMERNQLRRAEEDVDAVRPHAEATEPDADRRAHDSARAVAADEPARHDGFAGAGRHVGDLRAHAI